jgi:hypothetical protein
VRLAEAVREAFHASGAIQRQPAVTLELRAAGWQVSEDTVAEIMREQGAARPTGVPPARPDPAREASGSSRPDRATVHRSAWARAGTRSACGSRPSTGPDVVEAQVVFGAVGQ